jgi:nitrite reductase (NADH) large subunit
MDMIAPRRARLVLVGNGMAGVRALEEILSRAHHFFEIAVFGAEPHGNYNRIMLSPVLAGEKTFESITTHPKS